MSVTNNMSDGLQTMYGWARGKSWRVSNRITNCPQTDLTHHRKTIAKHVRYICRFLLCNGCCVSRASLLQILSNGLNNLRKRGRRGIRSCQSKSLVVKIVINDDNSLKLFVASGPGLLLLLFFVSLWSLVKGLR
jgi:hypothetical protein